MDEVQEKIDDILSTIAYELVQICVTRDRASIKSMVYHMIKDLNKLVDLNYERITYANRPDSTAHN